MPKYTKEFKIKLVLEYLLAKSITLRLENADQFKSLYLMEEQ